MSFYDHLDIVRQNREEKILGIAMPREHTQWRMQFQMVTETAIWKQDLEDQGLSVFNAWDEYSYWEEKADTIPWHGNGD